MCIGQSKQKQTQKTGQIHTGTQQTVTPVMQSKRGWMDRVQNVFSGFGFAHNQEIPEEIQNETIQDDAVLLSGKKIGSMDMIKARREYRKKKEVARVRRSVVDEYYEKINTEEASLDKTASFQQKDSWDMMHILETDKQQSFMDGCHSQKPAERVAALQMVYDKILKADFSIFAYQNDDDIYNHYEEKMRLMDAGHVLRKSLKEFVDNGGAMDEATLQELHARIDFLEQQRQMYISKDQTLLHPQYLMLRDNDLKELERLPAEELIQKSQNVDQTITALRTGIELLNTQAQETTSKKKKAEIQKKIDRAQRRIERLENLKSFIALYGAEMVRSRDEEGFQSLKPGEDPMAHLDTLRKQRKEHSRKQWTKNLEEFYAADLEMQQFQKLIIPVDFESGISEMATVHQAGLQGRVPTQANVVSLVYMYQHQKTMEDLTKPENLDDLLQVRDQVFDALSTQKGDDGDVQIVAPILRDMIRGFILQFSVVDGKAMYEQLLGITNMSDLTQGSMQSLVSGWGAKAGMLLNLCTMSTDIAQIAGLNKNVAQLALSYLSAKELKLFREAMFYTGNIGGCLQAFNFILIDLNAFDSDGKMKEECKDILFNGVEVLHKEVIENGEKKDEAYSNANGKAFQALTWFFRSFGQNEIINMSGSQHQEKQDNETMVDAASEWSLKGDPGVLYAAMAAGFYDLTTMKQIYEKSSSGGDYQLQSQAIRQSDLEGDEIPFGRKVVIRVNQDGTITPPAI